MLWLIEKHVEVFEKSYGKDLDDTAVHLLLDNWTKQHVGIDPAELSVRWGVIQRNAVLNTRTKDEQLLIPLSSRQVIISIWAPISRKMNPARSSRVYSLLRQGRPFHGTVDWELNWPICTNPFAQSIQLPLADLCFGIFRWRDWIGLGMGASNAIFAKTL